MKAINRLAGLIPVRLAATESALQRANKLCDPSLSEFTLDLDASGRLHLAERFEKWAKQLRASAAVLEE